MVKQRGGALYGTDERYCVDNGAMIAYAGLLAFMEGRRDGDEGHDVHAAIPHGRRARDVEEG